jgi:hypothetical protein
VWTACCARGPKGAGRFSWQPQRAMSGQHLVAGCDQPRRRTRRSGAMMRSKTSRLRSSAVSVVHRRTAVAGTSVRFPRA